MTKARKGLSEVYSSSNDARSEESGVAEAGWPWPLCHRTPEHFAKGFLYTDKTPPDPIKIWRREWPNPRSNQVEAIQVHDFVPGGDEVLDELGLGV